MPVHILHLTLRCVRFRLVLHETRGTRHSDAIRVYAFAGIRPAAILRARAHNNFVISSIRTIIDVRLVHYHDQYH